MWVLYFKNHALLQRHGVILEIEVYTILFHAKIVILKLKIL